MSDTVKEKVKQIVVCAACKFPEYLENGIVLTGARHWDDVMCAQADALCLDGGTEEQGFIDQFGTFLTREEAMEIVKKNGQPFNLERNGGQDDELYSEGLY